MNKQVCRIRCTLVCNRGGGTPQAFSTRRSRLYVCVTKAETHPSMRLAHPTVEKHTSPIGSHKCTTNQLSTQWDAELFVTCLSLSLYNCPCVTVIYPHPLLYFHIKVSFNGRDCYYTKSAKTKIYHCKSLMVWVIDSWEEISSFGSRYPFFLNE